MNEPHSIVDEIFTWTKSDITREQLILKSNTTEKISTPKTVSRSKLLSPTKGLNNSKLSDSCFSPMTLSRNAVKNSNEASYGWPILQGYLNIQELYLSTPKAVKQFKNLGDMLTVNFLEKHCVKPAKKYYLLFFKGKLFKF
jgi:hypothetical protein